MRCNRGQGTVEYLAVVLLVSVVLGGGATAAAATGAGADIATAVPHQVMRALCIVTHGDCERDRAPCDVATSTESRSWSAGVSVLRIGRDRVLVVDHRSDGKVVVTLTDTRSGGLQATRGGGVRIERGKRRLSLGGAATASAIAELGNAKTWVLPDDERTVDAFVAALRSGGSLRAPDQDVRVRDVNIAVSASASGAGGTTAGSATLHGSGGVRTDRVSGTTTYFLDGGADGVIDLSKTFAGMSAGASGEAGASAGLALTVDRDGRWVDLAVIASGELSAAGRLPMGSGPIADTLNVPTSAGRRWAAEAHLDLNDPGNLAAAHAALDRTLAVPPHPREAAAAIAALARRVDERAVIDVRTYALDRTREGFAVDAGNGLAAVAGSHESSTEHTRLIAARTRGLDGQWRGRADCLKEART
jgi:hypothetical protein